MTESSFTLKSHDGLNLFVRRWQHDGAPHRWTFVMVHGLGEHSGRYQHFAEWFTAVGAVIYALDQRGHGRSGGRRGHTPSLEALLDDVDLVLERAKAMSGGPLVLFGHSFGGLVALAYALDRPNRIDRAVFSAPLLMVKATVPGWKLTAGRLLAKAAPAVSMSNEVDPDFLSHDPPIAAAYRNDPLVHDRITAGLYGETIARGEEMIARAAELHVPFLLLHGADDRIVDARGSQRFFAGATGKARALKLYPGLYHEIFNELEHEKVFADVERWLSDQQAPSTDPPPAAAQRDGAG